jgi:cytochrome bd-type quinol oxidase subunit 2
LNVLIIIGITIRLLKFSYRQKAVKTNEKRLIVSMMIWLALCVTLGIGWIFGPFLDIFIQDKEQTSSKIKLWFFGIFIGLEGVWVLMVNGIFYVNQRVNKNNRRMFLNKNKN